MQNSVKVKKIGLEDFKIPIRTNKANVIGIINDSLITEANKRTVSTNN